MSEPSPDANLDSLLTLQPYIQSGPYLSGVVHDLNNALGAIIAYADLAGMGGNTDEELQSMMEDIKSAAQRASGLSDAMGQLVRANPPTRRAAHLPKMIQQVMAILEYRMRMSQVKVHVSLDDCTEHEVSCFGPELGRALLYLLINAAENVSDSKVKDVYLRVVSRGYAVSLHVKDSGEPMDAETFKQSLRVYSTSKASPHLGLGLSAVQAVADLHDGTLTYAADSGVCLSFGWREHA